MKHILVVVDGATGRKYLDRLRENKAIKNRYHIVFYGSDYQAKEKLENFIYYKLDPTSLSKLSVILNSTNFYQAMLVLSSKQDMLATYENIEILNPNLNIFIIFI